MAARSADHVLLRALLRMIVHFSHVRRSQYHALHQRCIDRARIAVGHELLQQDQHVFFLRQIESA
jgi:hypothetical protein